MQEAEGLRRPSDRGRPRAPLPRGDERLEQALAHALSLVRSMLQRESRPKDPASTDPLDLRRRLALSLGGLGEPVEVVWQRLDAVLAATPSTAGGRFVNQLFGGREPMAVAAELVATVANVSMYTFKAAGAQVLLEDELVRHMAHCCGLDAAEGTFTPGGSIANLVALQLARDAQIPDARDHGLGMQRLAVYASTEAHYSIAKACAVLGIGRCSLRSVAVDARGRLDAGALRTVVDFDVRNGVLPLAVVATAGTTVRGAFDPIDEIAGIARAAGAWLHVDGALGGSFAVSRNHRELLRGVERADSVAWNPHKLMGAGLQSSVLLVSRRGALARSLDQRADYLFQTHADEFDPGHRSLQCGRRNDALRLWALWRHLGDEGFAHRIDRLVDLARHAARRIADHPDLELVEEPQSVNVCFRVRGEDPATLCERLYRSGRLSIGHGLVGDQRVIRLPCVDPELGEPGIERVLAEVLAAGSGRDG